MHKEHVKTVFNRKLMKEIKAFKKNMLKRKPYEILANAYYIMCVLAIYEALIEMSNEMKAKTIHELIKIPDLIEFLYNRWLKRDDSFQYELEECISDSISALCEK